MFEEQKVVLFQLEQRRPATHQVLHQALIVERLTIGATLMRRNEARDSGQLEHGSIKNGSFVRREIATGPNFRTFVDIKPTNRSRYRGAVSKLYVNTMASVLRRYDCTNDTNSVPTRVVSKTAMPFNANGC